MKCSRSASARQGASPEAQRCCRRHCRRPRKTQRARPRVTADTNIYISALNFGGAPERLLRLAEAGNIQLVISDDVLAELEKTLRGEKFAWPESEVEKAMRQLSRITERVQPTRTLDIIKPKPSDNRILECAEAGNADYIVTGDKRHILPSNAYRDIQIVTVADFMKLLELNALSGCGLPHADWIARILVAGEPQML